MIEALSKMGCDENGVNCLVDRKTAERIAGAIQCEPLPTRYESPLTYALLKMSIESLAPAKARAYPGSGQVYFGTMPTGTINAMATVFPGTSDPIVILNRDIYHFTGKFSKAVSAAIPIEIEGDQIGLSYDKSKIRQRVRTNPWILEDFAQAMFFLVTNGSPAKAHETMLDAEHNRLHARLVVGLDSFIAAHELGHVVLGHTGKAERTFHLIPSINSAHVLQKAAPLMLLDYTRNDELEADEVALQLFVLANIDTDVLGTAIGAAGGDLFFLVVDAADRYRQLLGLPKAADDAHPSASVRSANLDSFLKSPEMSSLGLQALPDFRALTRAAFEVLLEEADPTLVKAFEEHRKSSR